MKSDSNKPNTAPSGPPLFSGPPVPTPPNRSSDEHSVPINAGRPTSSIPVGRKADIQLDKPQEINIHTMRDDLAQVKEQEKPPRAAVSKPSPSPISAPPTIAPLPKKVVSLPTKKESLEQGSKPLVKKEAAAPAPKAKRGSTTKVIVVLVIILIITSAIGGGVWWWLAQVPGPAAPPLSAVELVEAPEVLPAQAQLLVRYSLHSPQDRLTMQEAWAAKSGEAPTVAGLAAGNPTLLLSDTSINEFFYVFLPDEPRPYLALPKTDNTTNIFSQSSVVQVADLGRWYVVHPLDTDRYTSALSSGSLAGAGGLPELPRPFTTQWIMSPTFMQGLGSNVERSGPIFPSGDRVVINSRLDAEAQTLLFTSNTSGAFTTSSSALPLDRISPLVPADASFIRVGNNFAADIPRWTGDSGISLDTAVLEAPAVQQFIQALATPYGYYRRQGQDQTEDIGLVIALPDELRKTLSVPSDTVETAVRGLLPAIVGQSSIPVLAFTDNTHVGIPLRFSNIVGNTQAIDYALTDDYILIASSKEGMFTLLETVTNAAASIASAAPWEAIIETRNTSLTGEELIFAPITHPPITRLLPTAGEVVYVGVSTRPFGDSREIQGTIFFGEAQ